MTIAAGHMRTIADYEILQEAGVGGMGVVYKARQRSLGRSVALKVIRTEIADTPEYRERFLREARIAASVDHPHVVSVHDVGERDGRLFLAMQWVDGKDLKQVLADSGRLDADRAVAIVSQLAGALDAVHSVGGLVHRDVKPANVLLRSVGGKDHAYLTDFGIAKPSNAVDQLTKTGWVIGTPGYLAPEQIMGHEPGPRSDLYALGCLFFELVTGEPPFRAENEMALRWAHANNPRPRVSDVAPRLGTRYDGFLAVALAVDPDHRFASGRAFAAAVDTAHDHQSEVSTRLIPRRPHVPTAIGPPTPIPATRIPRQQSNAPRGYGTPPAGYPQERRSGSPLALVILAIVALAGITVGGLAAAGVFSKTPPSSQGPGSSQPQTTSTGATSSGKSGSTPSGPSGSDGFAGVRFKGHAFAVTYPAGWRVKYAERTKDTYSDTTIVSPSDENTLVRVDYTANSPSTDPMVDASPVVKDLSGVSGYEQVDLRRVTFEGFPAVHWEFLVPNSGVLVREEDVFFIDSNNNTSVAVLTQAPANRYGQLRRQFFNVRHSLAMN